MGFYTKIKNYFEKKDIVKKQLDHSIPNYNTYNPAQKTIVFLNESIFTPDKDSGSNRLKEIILAYKELNFNCIICTQNAYRTDNYIQYFGELGIIVYVETNRFKSYFDFLKSVPKVDFVWYYTPDTLNDNLKKMSKIVPNHKSIFDMVDLHFLRIQRAIELEPTRISLRKKYNKYFKIETKMAQKADYVIAISDVEKEIMTQYVDEKKLITISNVHYPKVKIEETPPFEQREGILFIGSTHTPNIDALYYLYQEIMPTVWEKIPNLKVNIIGSVNEAIKDIEDPNFVFHGYVENIDELFLSNRFMVAPLRFGAGVKGKIGQSFEYYLPVITSSIGAEGMHLVHNENALIDDTKEGFAEAIIDLYNNERLWKKLQNNSEESLNPFSHEILKNNLLKISSN